VQGRTVILTTHNMDEAERVAHRVAIIDHGELLVVDTPEALKRRIGAGDVLELDLADSSPSDLERARAAAAAVTPQIGLVGATLVVRATGMVELLPAIAEALRRAGLPPGEMRLRANSLEDVFIALTGRRLRE
jgi:ABC-2 type transport system ATP-binding protein